MVKPVLSPAWLEQCGGWEIGCGLQYQGDDVLAHISFYLFFKWDLVSGSILHLSFKITFTNTLAKSLLCSLSDSISLKINQAPFNPFPSFFPTGNETICIFLAQTWYLRFLCNSGTASSVSWSTDVVQVLTRGQGLGDNQV